ncbi:MAG: thioesterase superfamily protein [Marmoricola sp.]|nr:thioesterase superfamily protein [Marmoricola sp.]
MSSSWRSCDRPISAISGWRDPSSENSTSATSTSASSSHDVRPCSPGTRRGGPPSPVTTHRLEETERDLVEGLRGPAYDWRPVNAGNRSPGDVFDLPVRRSDMDETGRARAGMFFEYAQEARIRYLMNLHSAGERWSQHVVARTDVDYLAPLTHRPEPYAVHSWVAHLGSRSFTIRSDILDGDRVLARATVVMVTFDPRTQGTTEMADQQRARLEKELASS